MALTASEVLGIRLNATDEEIRTAYLEKVKEHPPDRSPEEFERIRDAYETLRDPRRRMREILQARESGPQIAGLFEGMRQELQFTGPDPWLEVLKGK